VIFNEPFEQYIGKIIAQEFGNSITQGVVFRIEMKEFSAIEEWLIFHLIAQDEKTDKFITPSIGIEKKDDGSFQMSKVFVNETNEYARQRTIRGLFEIERKRLEQ
jgi:hypothetical protein